MSNITKTSINNYYNTMKEANMPVLDGYGEYIVYNADGSELSKDIFAQVQQLFFHYVNDSQLMVDSMTSFLAKEIEPIDPNLRITFIPRTLYELLYLRTAIKEERTANCILQNDQTYRNFSQCDNKKTVEWFKNKINTCWHSCRFTNEDIFTINDNNYIHLLYRLNQYLIEKIKPELGKPLTSTEIVKHTEKRISFLKKHNQEFESFYYSKQYNTRDGAEGIAINFGINTPSRHGSTICWPMGIRNENSAQIIRHAVALECSKKAHNAFLLYRGGNRQKDQSLNSATFIGETLSYGSSLFAGCVRDPTATVFYYAIQGRDTFVMIIPKNQSEDAPFHISKIPALAQLLSRGEWFHSHSKVPDHESNKLHLNGIHGVISPENYEKIKSDKTTEELVEQLNDYHRHSYLLSAELEEISEENE